MELTESCHHRALIKEFYEIVFFTFVMVPDMRQFEISFHYIFCENGRLLDWPPFPAYFYGKDNISFCSISFNRF